MAEYRHFTANGYLALSIYRLTHQLYIPCTVTHATGWPARRARSSLPAARYDFAGSRASRLPATPAASACGNLTDLLSVDAANAILLADVTLGSTAALFYSPLFSLSTMIREKHETKRRGASTEVQAACFFVLSRTSFSTFTCGEVLRF